MKLCTSCQEYKPLEKPGVRMGKKNGERMGKEWGRKLLTQLRCGNHYGNLCPAGGVSGTPALRRTVMTTVALDCRHRAEEIVRRWKAKNKESA